jgi:hypothetical protein
VLAESPGLINNQRRGVMLRILSSFVLLVFLSCTGSAALASDEQWLDFKGISIILSDAGMQLEKALQRLKERETD